MQGVPLRAWGCPFPAVLKGARLRASLFPVLSNQDGFRAGLYRFPAHSICVPSRALHRPKRPDDYRAACLISRPSWRIQQAPRNQRNAPAAVGNTSKTGMPLERAVMPLERINGPGGHRYRPGSETAGKRLPRALHRRITQRTARPIVENSPALQENTSAAVVSPASRTPGTEVRDYRTEGEAA